MKKYLGMLLALIMLFTVMISSEAMAEEEELYRFTKPIQLIVGSSPGGGSDLGARLLAQALSREIGQEVVVVNMAGGGGTISQHHVEEEPADGYTLLFIEERTLTQQTLGTTDMKWNDFDIVALVGGSSTTTFVCGTTTGIQTFDDLKKLYEEKGPVTMAITYGSPSHFMAAAIEMASGVELVNIDTDSGSDKLLAVISGQTQLSQLAADAFLPYVESGEMYAFGQVGAERSKFLPDIPTFNEQGCEIGDFYKFQGVAYKKGTDEFIEHSLEKYIERAMSNPKTLEEYEAAYFDVEFKGSDEAREYLAEKEVFYQNIADFILSEE